MNDKKIETKFKADKLKSSKVMRFFNPVNDTHNEQYLGLEFDGSKKSSSNWYDAKQNKI